MKPSTAAFFLSSCFATKSCVIAAFFQPRSESWSKQSSNIYEDRIQKELLRLQLISSALGSKKKAWGKWWAFVCAIMCGTTRISFTRYSRGGGGGKRKRESHHPPSMKWISHFSHSYGFCALRKRTDDSNDDKNTQNFVIVWFITSPPPTDSHSPSHTFF